MAPELPSRPAVETDLKALVGMDWDQPEPFGELHSLYALLPAPRPRRRKSEAVKDALLDLLSEALGALKAYESTHPPAHNHSIFVAGQHLLHLGVPPGDAMAPWHEIAKVWERKDGSGKTLGAPSIKNNYAAKIYGDLATHVLTYATENGALGYAADAPDPNPDADDAEDAQQGEPDRSPKRRSRNPANVAIPGAVVVALCLLGVLIWSPWAGDERRKTRLQLDLVANAGKSTFQLASQPAAMSPACGCLDPRGAEGDDAAPWLGLSVPARGFALGVTAEPTKGIDADRWQLTGMVPDVDVVDWYAPPTHTLRMEVTATDGTSSRTLFAGRTTHFVVLTDKAVTVDHDAMNPYVAVVPAAGATTTVTTEAPPRAEWSGRATVQLATLARRALSAHADDYDSRNPAHGQRGPVIDLLGPTASFEVDNSTRTEIYAGRRKLPRPADGATITITIAVPFALRLQPSPAPTAWTRDLPRSFERQRRDAAAANDPDPAITEQIVRGPLFQGRYIFEDALPAYQTSLTDWDVPTREQWQSFVARARTNGDVKSMLAPAKHDTFSITEFRLPPVEESLALGVFGPITHLTSTALEGALNIDDRKEALLRGEPLSVTSRKGIQAAPYQAAPLASLGSDRPQSSLSGEGRVVKGAKTE